MSPDGPNLLCGASCQRLFDVCPEARGDLPEAERRALRTLWFGELARNPTARWVHVAIRPGIPAVGFVLCNDCGAPQGGVVGVFGGPRAGVAARRPPPPRR
jgi:hypothetical protein